MKITELPLSKRTKNTLIRAGITNINRLKYFIREKDLSDIENLGEVGINEIKEFIIEDWSKV